MLKAIADIRTKIFGKKDAQLQKAIKKPKVDQIDMFDNQLYLFDKPVKLFGGETKKFGENDERKFDPTKKRWVDADAKVNQSEGRAEREKGSVEKYKINQLVSLIDTSKEPTMKRFNQATVVRYVEWAEKENDWIIEIQKMQDLGRSYVYEKELKPYTEDKKEERNRPFKGTVYDTNYSQLETILGDLSKISQDYRKVLKAKGYQDFDVEYYGEDRHGRIILSMSHWGEQNGDLMSDPRMEVAVDVENHTVEALTFENHYVGVYKTVYDDMFEQNSVNLAEKKGQNSFLKTWLKNIIDQGHKEDSPENWKKIEDMTYDEIQNQMEETVESYRQSFYEGTDYKQDPRALRYTQLKERAEELEEQEAINEEVLTHEREGEKRVGEDPKETYLEEKNSQTEGLNDTIKNIETKKIGDENGFNWGIIDVEESLTVFDDSRYSVSIFSDMSPFINKTVKFFGYKDDAIAYANKMEREIKLAKEKLERNNKLGKEAEKRFRPQPKPEIERMKEKVDKEKQGQRGANGLLIYHDSFTSACTEARSLAEKAGYTINDDDWFREVATRYKAKPDAGQTSRFSVELYTKKGNVAKKALHFQVYGLNDDGKLELNAYIS